MHLIILSISYILVVLSVTGYGFIFRSSCITEDKTLNFGYLGVFGLFFLTIYSYLSSFFINHGLIHNSIILLIGIIFFILNSKRNFFHNKKEYLIFFLIFLILFFSLFLYKNHEDFVYYHFPYTNLLNEFTALFGLGTFNHGFSTPSSLFYINSLFYLPFVKYYSFHFAAILVLGFSSIILMQNIISSYNKNNYNFITYLSLLSFIFINIIFFRIGAHGTDKSAQILIFILIIDVLIIINFFKSETYKFKVRHILITLSLIISFKAFFILYLFFLFYLIFFLIKKIEIKKLFSENIKYLIYFALLLFFVLLVNFQSSGCFLYPLKITCLTEFPWSRKLEIVEYLGKWYEQWAKAGAGPNFRVENPDLYIQNFNWVSNWFKMYWKEKGINTTLGIILIGLITFLFFFSKNIKLINKKIKYFEIYIIILILFFEWFYKHPTLRYGGYSLLALIFFVPLSIFLDKFYHTKKNLKKRTVLIFVLILTIFLYRNISRFYEENKKYNYNFIKDAFYKVDEKHYLRHNVEIKNLIQEFEICKTKKQNQSCDALNLRMGVYLNKYYYFK